MKETKAGRHRRADAQAAALSCALVAGTAAGVYLACTLLPPGGRGAAAVLVAAVFCAAGAALCWVCFRRISNPTYRDMANTDQLTGLKSRNAFEIDLKNLHAGSGWRRAGFVLVDLDNLKQVNDSLGHTAGDAYLRSAADALYAAAHGVGMSVYRVGGDEFAVLMLEADQAALEALGQCAAERFARAAQDWPVALSLSVGCAVFDGARERNLYDTYRQADLRMYAHKRERRAPEEGP